MTVVTDQRAGQALARRLRALRVEAGLAQRDVAEALGVSAPSVSAWENESSPAVPPVARLEGYARLFCREHPAETLPDPLPDPLTPSEEQRREDLVVELVGLRDAVTADAGRTAAGPARRFWHFPDEAQVRIICGAAPRAELAVVPAADPWDPGHLAALALADLDAVVELFGHVRAENPGADVRFLTQAQVTADDLTGHVVVLGPAGSWGALREPVPRRRAGDDAGTAGLPATAFDWFVRRLELPIAVQSDDGDRYDARFVVTRRDDGSAHYLGHDLEPWAPRFLRSVDEAAAGTRLTKNGRPQLEYDVAVLARQPNPMNTATSLTLAAGLFTRGSYGAVRAFTDANLRRANERWLDAHLDRDRFWMLLRVPVFQGVAGAETVTPDLARPFHVLTTS